jgi:hypothetical protein
MKTIINLKLYIELAVLNSHVSFIFYKRVLKNPIHLIVGIGIALGRVHDAARRDGRTRHNALCRIK